MAKGDHIYVWRAGYTHHGIDSGNSTIIHYSGEVSQKPCAAAKKMILDEFADNAVLYAREYINCNPPDVVIRRAESRLKKQDTIYI